MPKTPVFSPSLNHASVRKNLTPKLTFAGSELPVGRRQQTLRRKLRQLLAMPEVETVPLKPRTLWKREVEHGTIEKIVFAAEKSSDVPAYLCLPRNVKPPYTTMICLQGHSSGAHVSVGLPREDDGLEANTEGDRDFGLECMKRGLAALCIEQRSFGERREKHQEQVSPHPCHDATMQALMLGRTLAGERVFDVERGLDYLAARGDINMQRVGAMGNSGGGTITLLAAAVLPRIRFAMPSCAFCTYAESIMSIYHCGDNYIPGLLQYAEAADVLGLFAPRPLVVVAGRDDDIFPIKGVRRAFGDLEKIYQSFGAKKNCRLVVGDGGHRFYADDAWPVLLEMIGEKT